MYFTNISGGEPFTRAYLKEVIRELYKKLDHIIISTNGFFTDRIIDLSKDPSDLYVSQLRDWSRLTMKFVD